MSAIGISPKKAVETRLAYPAQERNLCAIQSSNRGEAPLNGRLDTKTPPLICVVDHDYKLRRDVILLFQSEKPQIEYFSSADSFLSRQIHHGPCCIIMDVQTTGMTGIELLQLIAREERTERIILVSGQSDISLCARAFKAGASDFHSKPVKEEHLRQAIRDGLTRSEELLLIRREKQTAHALLNKLTPREQQVLGFVIAGTLNKVIAAELGTTEKTIKKHRGQVMTKLQVFSVAELVHFSLLSGLKPTCPYGTKVPYTATCQITRFAMLPRVDVSKVVENQIWQLKP